MSIVKFRFDKKEKQYFRSTKERLDGGLTGAYFCVKLYSIVFFKNMLTFGIYALL